MRYNVTLCTEPAGSWLQARAAKPRRNQAASSYFARNRADVVPVALVHLGQTNLECLFPTTGQNRETGSRSAAMDLEG